MIRISAVQLVKFLLSCELESCSNRLEYCSTICHSKAEIQEVCFFLELCIKKVAYIINFHNFANFPKNNTLIILTDKTHPNISVFPAAGRHFTF